MTIWTEVEFPTFLKAQTWNFLLPSGKTVSSPLGSVRVMSPAPSSGKLPEKAMGVSLPGCGGTGNSVSSSDAGPQPTVITAASAHNAICLNLLFTFHCSLFTSFGFASDLPRTCLGLPSNILRISSGLHRGIYEASTRLLRKEYVTKSKLHALSRVPYYYNLILFIFLVFIIARRGYPRPAKKED